MIYFKLYESSFVSSFYREFYSVIVSNVKVITKTNVQ